MGECVEDRYVALRQQGYDRRGAAMELMLSEAFEARCERFYRTASPRHQEAPGRLVHSGRPAEREGSYERPYGYHSAHVALCRRYGGFPSYLEDDRGLMTSELVDQHGQPWRAGA